MKTSIFFFLGILINITGIAQPHYTDTIIIENFPNGKVSIISYEGPKDIIIDGVKLSQNFKIIHYFSNGNKYWEKIETNQFCKDTSHVSEYTEWYENGNRKITYKKKNNQYDGLNRVWFENGKKKDSSFWNCGNKIGIQKSWYENGQLRYVAQFENGKQFGASCTWTIDGKFSHSDSGEGEVRISYEKLQNKDIFIRSCKNDYINNFYQDENGFQFLFDNDGNMTLFINYRKGILNGTEYIKKNDYTIRGKFNYGNGKDTSFDRKGRIQKISFYSFNVPTKVFDTMKVYSKEIIIAKNMSRLPDSILSYKKNGELYLKTIGKTGDNQKVIEYKKGEIKRITYFDNLLFKIEKYTKHGLVTQYYDKDGFMYRQTTNKGDEFFDKKKK
jgi:antitoxin component YwqK of YwqJK toxin-antitoxin module